MGTKFGLESLNGRDRSEKVGVDVRAILNWILWKYDERCGLTGRLL
jgi:hypothetical protein